MCDWFMQKKNMMHGLGLLCCYQGKDYLLTKALQRVGDQPNA